MVQYNTVAKLLHWVMAVLIIGLLILGLSMESLENKKLFFFLHKSFGLLVLFLGVIRLIWRLNHQYPELPEGSPKILSYLAKMTVIAFYFMIFTMPLSGILLTNSFGASVPFFGLFNMTIMGKNPDLTNIMALYHEIGAFFLIFLIILHIFAGLFHQFILKDNLLKRLY